MAKLKRGSDEASRARMRSPLRPGVAKREDQERFWQAIAAGRTSEDAGRDAGADDGERAGDLTSAEREELHQLRREVRRLRRERELLSKAAAWFAQNDVTSRPLSWFACEPLQRSGSSNS
ncbi:MAG: hypothetical protein AAF360_14145 [Pseudomonadota bacterium]